MKNLIKGALPFCLLFLLNHSLLAQPNEATVYELRDDNIAAVANAVIASISSPGYPSPIAPPSFNAVYNFLSTPFNNQIYTYDDNSCPKPGIRIFTQGSNWFFNFDNLAGTTGNLLFIGSMGYGPSVAQNFFSVNGPQLYNGINYPSGSIQYQIFIAGTLCNSCPSSSATQCHGRVEVVIVDKNIL